MKMLQGFLPRLIDIWPCYSYFSEDKPGNSLMKNSTHSESEICDTYILNGTLMRSAREVGNNRGVIHYSDITSGMSMSMGCG